LFQTSGQKTSKIHSSVAFIAPNDVFYIEKKASNSKSKLLFLLGSDWSDQAAF